MSDPIFGSIYLVGLRKVKEENLRKLRILACADRELTLLWEFLNMWYGASATTYGAFSP